MTIQGILILVLIGLILISWVLNLVRRDRLYVGYGVIFLVVIIGAIIILSVPGLLTLVTHLVGAVFPASALTLIALCFIIIMLVYIMSQLTLISNRLAIAVQEIALQRAKAQAAGEKEKAFTVSLEEQDLN